jgi:hypothetical protein
MTSEQSVPFLYTPKLEQGEEWLDVILHFHSSTPEKADHTKLGVPIAEKFALSSHIWIVRLDAPVAKQIVEACSPRNLDVPIHDQQGHTYAFVRKSRFPGLFHDFGGIEELGATIALSRLIRPTTMGLRWAARVSMVNRVVKQILAFQPRGIVVDAFCSKAIEQDWLTQEDGDRLRRLMGYITIREPMHKRVHNAYWHHEYAIRTYYADHRWVFVCTGLEALVHSSGMGTTGQFISRVARLAKREGINFTGDELATASRHTLQTPHRSTHSCLCLRLERRSPSTPRTPEHSPPNSSVILPIGSLLFWELFGVLTYSNTILPSLQSKANTS